MGLFRRDTPESPEQPAPARVASAAQRRGRARRRLLGAVALVLAGVIVLPMALDSEPVPVASDIPILIPDRASPYQPEWGADTSTTDEPLAMASGALPEVSAAGATVPPTALPTPSPASPPAQAPAAQGSVTPPQAAAGRDDATAGTAAAPSTARPAPASATPPAPAPTRPNVALAPSAPERTDDGSQALALLEGRTARSDGAYVLQIAAYGNQADAQARRDQLLKAGVANAFVQTATVNGKQQYRLRVGPFANREAAQALQPRLRALGYDNGFVATQ